MFTRHRTFLKCKNKRQLSIFVPPNNPEPNNSKGFFIVLTSYLIYKTIEKKSS